MMSDAYRRGLPVALARGTVSVTEIDESVRRVLTLKKRLGLFDHPFARGAMPESAVVIENRRRRAPDIAARAVVMLKNEGDALPISAFRAAALRLSGPWPMAGRHARRVVGRCGTRRSGDRARRFARRITESRDRHAVGCAIDDADLAGIPEALRACEGANVILLCLGEAAVMSGEAASRAHLGLPGVQAALAEAVFELAQRLRVPVIVILFSGRPLIVPRLMEKANAVLAAWFLGSEAGNAIADLLTGRVSPGGRTPVTWPRAEGQIPIFFSERSGGRPFDREDKFTSKYLDESNEPSFPFGFGLTYGRFELSNLRLSSRVVSEHDTLTILVDLINHGLREAEETVFLFRMPKLPACRGRSSSSGVSARFNSNRASGAL